MASSNRHWPSMFKSKPSNTTHNQWQHDINSSHISTGCHRNPYTSGCDEERTPEPKPRWNPRPEQIRILESIFNSGMVNPPRDEIRKIRAQLQEYGEVGDANVFYWFQNRKSRSKNKQRQFQNIKPQPPQTTPPPPNTTTIAAALVAAPTSSSSSSGKSSPSTKSNEKPLSVSPTTLIDMMNLPTATVSQPFLQAASSQFLNDSFFFQGQQLTGGSNSEALTQGFSFPDLSCVAEDGVGNCPTVLLSELMLMSQGPLKKDEDEKMKMQQQMISDTVTTASNTAEPSVPPSLSLQSYTSNHILQVPGLGETAPQKSTVFINDVCFEVAMGPFNVSEAFGDDAVLIQSSGQPVLTNEWGVTQQPLQHGAFYYLLRTFAPSPDDRTIVLI